MAHQILTDLDFNNVSKLLNLPNGVADGDAATVGQLKAAIEGLAWKTNARVSTAANINLAAPGATIDGITMVSGDRVLVKAQTAAAQNGIYIWNGAAVPMTRSLDTSTVAELEQAVVTVEEGTAAGSSFRQTQINFTLDTGDVLWTGFGSSVASASESVSGSVELATQVEVDTGTDDQRAITPLKLATWAGRLRKFTQDIGDGSATSYTVTHNFGSRDVKVDVYRNSGNYDSVGVEVRHTSINAITIVFSSPPTTNQFRVIILG